MDRWGARMSIRLFCPSSPTDSRRSRSSGRSTTSCRSFAGLAGSRTAALGPSPRGWLSERNRRQSRHDQVMETGRQAKLCERVVAANRYITWTYAFTRYPGVRLWSVSYTHLRAHETDSYLVCRLLL